MSWRFVVEGAPRTKKTHNRVVRCGRFLKVLPSAAYVVWNERAKVSLARQMYAQRGFPISKPVNVCALIYREKAIGDAVGFYQAIADTLEDASVLENDQHIVSWDGSQLLKDAKRPRVEIEITEIQA